MLLAACDRLRLSARGFDRVRRVALTLADLARVPGVGAKTAAALLQRFDDLDAIYAELDQVLEVPVRGAARVRERLAAHRDDAYLARRLTRVHEEVPLDLPSTGLAVGTPDFDALEALFAAADFGTALRRRVRQLAPS